MIPERPSAREIVVVTRIPASGSEGDLRSAVADSIAGVIGLVGYSVQTAVTLSRAVVSATINGTLDRLVPVVADAIISRVDLTDVVLERVNLRAIILRALDELDLTTIVVERVDFDTIINRIPIVEIADYVINEIDLPDLIRESTGGVADNALNAARQQASDVDSGIARIIDRFLLRTRERRLLAGEEIS